jgi:carbamoyl-phosphate synthase large subunit
MNILLTSVGRRVKLVEYFKSELSVLNGNIIAIDCDENAPALYAASDYEIVPEINDPTYIKELKVICKKYDIRAILSLIDPELTILAEHKNEFKEIGIEVIVSDSSTVEKTLDKYQMYEALKKHQIPVVPTYIDLKEILTDIDLGKLTFPLFIKPRYGSASIGVLKIENRIELEFYFKEGLIVQPLLLGKEYGIDAYRDLISKETINIFIKEKLLMRVGETDKSMAVKNPMLFVLIEEVLNKLDLIGPIDIDSFIVNENEYYILEINPRFGGGYPHAYENGQNFVKHIIQNLKGLENKRAIGQYDTGNVMLKFDDINILNKRDSDVNYKL